MAEFKPTDEAVEAVASARALADGYDPNAIPASAWNEKAEHYRALARAAIAAFVEAEGLRLEFTWMKWGARTDGPPTHERVYGPWRKRDS